MEIFGLDNVVHVQSLV